MTALVTDARVTVTKTRRWPRRHRFTMELHIGGINTGLHWHLNKKEAKSLAPVALANAAQLLESYGLMDTVYAKVALAQDLGEQVETPAAPLTGLPPKGSKVELIRDLGSFKAGAIGTVTNVDEPDGSLKPDSQYPLRVALTTMGGQTVEIPMNLSEVKAVAS